MLGRYRKEVSQEIGQWLLENEKDVCQRKLAKSLAVSPRTLRNWKNKAKVRGSSRWGRPTYSAQDRWRAMILVCRELRRQGYPGSPAIYEILKDRVPRRLVNEYVKIFKQRHEKRKRVAIEENRCSIEVLNKDVVWAQDGTHLGKVEGTKIEAQVIKDRGTLCTIGLMVGSTASEDEILLQLKLLKAKRGLPLIWMTDNGSMFCGGKVAKFLEEEKVIHLRSAPRVSQHNGSAERTNHEIKYPSVLGRNVRLDQIKDGFEEVVMNVININEHRPRMSKGMITAKELELELPTFHVKIDREGFYDACVKELKAVDESYEKRRARLEKRRVVFELLSGCGLISINRGVRKSAS